MDDNQYTSDAAASKPEAPSLSFRRGNIRLSSFSAGAVTWHWHSEAVLLRATRGRILCRSGATQADVGSGECLFVNAGAIHMYAAGPGCDEADAETLLFTPAFIADPASEAYARCVAPLADCQAVPLVALNGPLPWQAEARRLSGEVFRIDPDRFGSELLCRGLLTELWLLIAENTEAARTENQSVNDQRARRMLAFIQAHFSDDLTIDAIAGSAGISRSECFRCFKRAISKKPIEYLTEFRIERAADMLLNTDMSITDICFRCGFSSPSYFGKVFRGITGLSPRSYRQRRERLTGARK